MKFLFNNNFWKVDHPLVHALKNEEITPEEFLEKIEPTDPFQITDRPHPKDPELSAKWITAYDKAGIAREIAAKKHSRIHQFRKLMGLDLLKIEKHEEVLKKAFPFLEIKYKDFHTEVEGGCTNCKKNGLAMEMIQLLASLAPHDAEVVAVLEGHLEDKSLRCLRGDDITDEELLKGMRYHPFDKMEELPSIERISFFESSDCKKGKSKDNCKLCRTSLEHREMLNKKYEIKMQQPSTIGDVEVTTQIYNHPFDAVNFDCPFKDEVVKMYPGILEQFKNAMGAFRRVLSAKLAGKSVLLPQPEINKRLSICNQCEYHDMAMGRCTVCSCFIRAKMQLNTEVCPMEKWPALPNQ